MQVRSGGHTAFFGGSVPLGLAVFDVRNRGITLSSEERRKSIGMNEA